MNLSRAEKSHVESRSVSIALATSQAQTETRDFAASPWSVSRMHGATAARQPTHTFDRSSPISHIRLRAPTADQVAASWREPIAGCLSAAFSTGLWKDTPMPLGDSSDRHSARGILAELGPSVQALVATAATETGIPSSILGCVIGSPLNDDLIDQYRLASYGARPGDALFAYIGVRPSLQGCRVQPAKDNRFQLDGRADRADSKRPGASLASLLFSNWLTLPGIRRCPRVFIRTREVLTPIQALAERNGFQYCGKFYLDFHGNRQDRIVYRRSMA